VHSLIVDPDVTIGFNSTVYSVSEGSSIVNITVSILSGILARNAGLIVDNRDDSAQGNSKVNHTLGCTRHVVSFNAVNFRYSPAPSDYMRGLPRSLVFNGGTRSQTVTVTIRNDTIVEQQFESIFMSLRTRYSDPAVILSPGNTTITIEDDDGKLTHNSQC